MLKFHLQVILVYLLTISSQFTVEMRIAAKNCQKNYQNHFLRGFKVV